VTGAAVALAVTLAQMLAETPGGATPRPAATVSRFAIVIGNNRPETGRAETLRYADDDALATHRLLLEAGVDSVLLARLDDDSRKLHPDFAPRGAPRGKELDDAFTAAATKMRAAAQLGAETELLVFYSGHGDVDGGEGYVVLEDRRLTRTLLHALLSGSPATRIHVFVDACKSYFLAFEKGPGGRRTPYAASLMAAGVPGRLANTGFVLSTTSDRDSHEWERYQAGILSHELRSALRGAADADRDGRITYAELGAFLMTANRDIPNPSFRPDFIVRPPGRDLAREVLRWDASRKPLLLGGGGVGGAAGGPPLGHVYVESARGERLVDAHPARDQALALRLPDERPLFVRKHGDTAELVIDEREPVTVAWQEATPEIGRKGALHLAFEKLFASPFGPPEVTAYSLPPVDLELRETAQAPAAVPNPRIATVRTVAGWTAVVAGTAGVVLSALAAQRYYAGGDASQVEIESLNQQVRQFNIASVVCYAVAAVAGGTWLWATRQ
jgi:caspase domain-containing protein